MRREICKNLRLMIKSKDRNKILCKMRVLEGKQIAYYRVNSADEKLCSCYDPLKVMIEMDSGPESTGAGD